jgi:hypothetical protein
MTTTLIAMTWNNKNSNGSVGRHWMDARSEARANGATSLVVFHHENEGKNIAKAFRAKYGAFRGLNGRLRFGKVDSSQLNLVSPAYRIVATI